MKSTAKRLLLGLVMIVCLTVLMAICVGAEDVTYSEGLEFTSNGDGTCYVSGIGTCTDSVVHIPSVSPDGDAVTVIGNAAFTFCSDLTSVTIPEGVTSIGDDAFYGCDSLTSITIPEGVTSIGGDAFYGCDSLTSINIPEGVMSISSGAFNGCSSLTSITIPDSVTSIGDYAFHYCSNLTSFTIPDRVTSIGNLAFYDCSGLTSITIPNSVTSIGNYPFGNCTNLTSITVAEGNAVYHSVNNCLIETASKVLVAGCQTSVIPDDGSVTSIGANAFRGCNNLTSITIPNSVTSIGDRAFRFCTGLMSITIPNSVTSIGEAAFTFCSSLTSITIPNSVTSIEGSTFEYCTGLTSIAIPDSVTNIGEAAFLSCTSLTSITIPNSVTCIGDSAFRFCTGLMSITIPNSLTSIGKFVFEFCFDISDVYYNGTEAQWDEITIEECNDPLLNATIHFLGDAEVVSNTATCTEAGEITYECGCGTLHTYPHPALGHDKIFHAAKDPTCTEIGWNAYETCSRCPYTTYEEIPAIGHTEVTDPAVDPTCTATGLTEGKRCSVCGEILVAQETIPTADHSFTKYAHDYNSHWLVCKNCDAEPENSVKQPHKLVWTVTDNTNEDEDKLSCTLRAECACGYGKEKPFVIGTAKITGASLALGDTLTLKYYATLPAANMDVVMRFTYEGETHDVNGVKDEKTGEYVFSFDRIPPSKMDAIVKAELILDNEDGSETVLAVKEEYSITQYCADAKQDNPDNAALNHLLNDLETYNKAAEDYENGISKDPSDVAWEPLTDTDFSLSEPADETVRFKAAGVRFGFVNRLFFKFTADDLNGLTVKVNDTLYTESDFTLVEGTENTYIIYSEGINATEFDKIFTVVLMVNGEEVQTLEYSVKSYVEAKQDDPEIGALVRALYKYGKSSELYLDEM